MSVIGSKSERLIDIFLHKKYGNISITFDRCF